MSGDLLSIARNAHALVGEHTGRDRDFVPEALRLLLDHLETGERRHLDALRARLEAHDRRAQVLAGPFVALEAATRAGDVVAARSALEALQDAARRGFAPPEPKPEKPPAPPLNLIHPRRRGFADPRRAKPRRAPNILTLNRRLKP